MEVLSANTIRDLTPLTAGALVAGASAVVVDLHDAAPADVATLARLTCTVVGIGDDSGTHPDVDVLVDDEAAAAAVVDAVDAHPLASVALVLLLRATAGSPVDAALVAESSTYSALQAGPEHQRWLAARGDPRRYDDDGERVLVASDAGTTTIVLARPARGNAVDAAMQEALRDALLIAEERGDDIVVRGDGSSFSTGGDLDEFGTLADPASAHLVRVARSPGRVLARVAARTTVFVHGDCFGAGVELPAFAGRTVAHPGTTFTLPEVAMGLVPGAGGTVSIPRRIGRQRTGWLAITGATIDASTALKWGLVDEIADLPPV